MLNSNIILVPIPCPCGQHKLLPDAYGPRDLMVSTYCKLADDPYLTNLIDFFESPDGLDGNGCINAQVAFWALEDGGFLDVALHLYQHKTEDELFEMVRALREAAATIATKGGSQRGVGYIRAIARWYYIVRWLGCGARVHEVHRKYGDRYQRATL